MSSERLSRLSAAGVAVWLDDLSRKRLASGDLDHLRRDHAVVGVTTNPTIFASALADPGPYTDQIRDLAARGVSVDEATRMLTTYDVRWACDVLRPVHETSHGVDGRVSVEVDPRLAHDTSATLAEARALWWLVDRPNLYIKIPATPEGLPAISAALAEGISVNVTLIFSLYRYSEVMEAFLTGLERAAAAGRDLSTLGSVASFFVSRVDSEVDRRLLALGPAEARGLRGRAATANARLAFQRHERVFAGERWRALAARGARPQRPLWASTSMKDPGYRDVAYVEELVAPGTVNTMPEPTLRAFADHGQVRPTAVTEAYAEAKQTIDDLTAVGVDYHAVVDTLEREGVEKFAASWSALLDGVARTMDHPA
ncbi:MAG: transaldolase [Dactylosporangium sp.]|nr:transaldolase [Dactylosporangium sp.]NNJ63357.1 transaldolase [Dactylosporangium sp.]